MDEFKRMILKVSDVEGASATVPTSPDHTDGSWLDTDIYEGELFLNTVDNVLQTRTESGIVNLNSAGPTDASRIVQNCLFSETVTKGDPLIITGYNVGSGIMTVAKADASNSSLMPAYGLASEDYDSGATGTMVVSGNLIDIDTSAFIEGSKIYVAVGGGLTNIKPVEPNLIQNVGLVARSNANNGSIEVVAIGRANDVPNLPVGHTFIGTSTNPTTIDLTTELNNTTLIETITVGTSRSLLLTDRNKNIENSADVTITVPTNLTVEFPIGTQIFFTKKAESITFVGESGVAGTATIYSVDGLLEMGRINCGASLLKIGTDEWNLIGELV